MLPPEPSRIFISYARKDGAALAQRLQSDLTKQGFNAWLDIQRLRAGATWTKEIEVALDQAKYVLVLLTHGSYVSEICRSEQLRALRKGTCVIPIRGQTDTDIPLHLEAVSADLKGIHFSRFQGEPDGGLMSPMHTATLAAFGD